MIFTVFMNKSINVKEGINIYIQMKSALPKYCEHFEFLKPCESLHLEKDAACKFCFQGTSGLWLCLTKGCGTYVCGKNELEHLISHLEQSRRTKKFHSIFINPNTAEIRCVHCSIEIGDLDIISNGSSKSKQDPFPLRVKLLPALADLVSHRITGQLQNSQGHRRISRGLVGIFSTKYNYTINTSLQFLAHSKFIRQLLLQLRVSQKSKVIWAMQQIMRSIDRAQYRAIHSNIISELLYQQFPELLGYKRKDPFEIIVYFFNIINEETIHYSVGNQEGEGFDEWDLFYRKNMVSPHYLIYSAIESTLSMNYYCQNCQVSSSILHNIQFLKLNIPKKKRKVKQVEKQLAAHRATSPVKTRRKSLINLFKEDECPLTVPELIIELTKSPIHKEMTCQKCSSILKKTKLHFQKLPDILIIQIARISKERSSIDQTQIQLSTEPLDMGTFTDNPDEEIIYDFQSAVCIEKGCLFPIVVVGQANKQKYVIRNEIVQLSNKQKMNPYILCYKKRPSETAKQKLTMITDDLQSQRKKTHQLPDFWYLQLTSGIERPFRNQLVCKHNYLKPLIQSKMHQPIRVSQDVYEDLFHFYQNYKDGYTNTLLKKRSSLSPRMQGSSSKYAYQNQICEFCSEEMEHLNVRRKKQKEYVLAYDKLKSQNLPYCMISSVWIKKWSNFLYNHNEFAYMPKGFPLPPSIDNKTLLDGNKCKANLVKNEDFKILNIYLWKFLKQLYGGGPQIRYKWKQGRQNLDEQLISEIKQRASELKYIYSTNLIESPKKMVTSLSFIDKSSYSEGLNESFLPHPEKPNEEQEILQEQT